MKRMILTTIVILSIVFISQAQTVHKIGEAFGGGIIIDVTTDGQHGLIAETIDQSGGCTWSSAPNKVSENHSEAGKKFSDWRLPSKSELMKMYNQNSLLSGFSAYVFWSSTEGDNGTAWSLNFSTGAWKSGSKYATNCVRAVRSF